MKIGLWISAYCLSSITWAAPAPQRPNILFIISDDHAVQALGSSEHDSPVPLPALRQLARQGMVFDRSYCTNSISGPSRASILTGRHSHRNGFLYNYGGAPFEPEQPSWPQMLQAAGYHTGLLGKWHLKSSPRGFDQWSIFPDQGEYWDPIFITNGAHGKQLRHRERGYATDLLTTKAIDWLENRDKSKPFALMLGHKSPHRNWIPAPRHLDKIKQLVAKLSPPATLHDNWENRPAQLSLNEQSISRHFCNWNDAHLIPSLIPFDVMCEIIPKAALRKMITSGQFEGQIPANFDLAKHEPSFAPKTNLSPSWGGAQAAGVSEIYQRFYAQRTQQFVQDMREGKVTSLRDITEQRWRWYMEDYLGCLLSLDESIGDLMHYLKQHQLEEDTLVIYVGDQGFYLGEHGMYDKRWIFEQSMRMPLIMRWPGTIAKGTRSMAMVQNIDYAPTLATLAQADSAENMASFDGISMTGLFSTGEAEPFQNRSLYYAFFEHPAEHNAPIHDGIRSPRYTFARIWQPQPEQPADKWLLIDNESDPEQMINQATNPDYAPVFERLKAQYLQLRRDYAVPDNSPACGKSIKGMKPIWNTLK